MSTPTGDHAYLHELEIDVETELTVAQTGPAGPAASSLPGDVEIPDPDAERYEVRLRALLGAVEALEDRPRPTSEPEAGSSC